jgi:acetyl-CoA synthetase
MTTEDRNDAATIENLLREERTFPPSEEFVANALLNDPEIYERTASEEGFRAFWAEEGNRLDWMEPWTELYEWNPPYAKWFLGGKLNVSVNCLDRHVASGLGDRVAYFWEGEPGDTRTITYQQLLDEVCRFTNALRGLGVKKGDKVAIYMPMIPELPVAMLACARIGAAAQRRLRRLQRRCPGGPHRRRQLQGRHHRRRRLAARARWCRSRSHADEAIGRTSSVQHCVVVKRTGEGSHGTRRDHWYHELVEGQPATADPEPMDSEDLLYLLYTSGTTAKPKGIMHTTGGYLPAWRPPIGPSSTSSRRPTSTGAWPTSAG